MVNLVHTVLFAEHFADFGAAVAGAAHQNHRLIGRSFQFLQFGQPFFLVEFSVCVERLQFVAARNQAGGLPFLRGADVYHQRVLILLHRTELLGVEFAEFCGLQPGRQ